MSRQPPPNPAMDVLLRTLDLERLERSLFRGESPQVGWQRVFGGQVIAQALVAATRTVGDDRHVHSLHAYFVLPGDPSVPIIYDVETIRDGGTFATRRVVAVQHGKPIFFMTASFQIDEDGFEHQTAMPDVPPPESLPDETEMRAALLAQVSEPIRAYWQRPRPIELRPLSLDRYLSSRQRQPRQDIWVRTTGPVPQDRGLRAAVLAYLSDMTLLDTALAAHGTTVFDRSLQIASLDHAMWFHRPAPLDDWLLYSQDSPCTAGGRGLTHGALFSRSGALVASVAQEGLIRKKAKG